MAGARWAWNCPLGIVAVGRVDRLPHRDRQRLAGPSGALARRREGGGDRGRGRRGRSRARRGPALTSAPAGHLLDPHDGEERVAGGSLVDRRVLEDELGLHVEDPGGVLRPLDVASDPEHGLGDPAQHPGRPLAVLLLLLLRLRLRLAQHRPGRHPARVGRLRASIRPPVPGGTASSSAADCSSSTWVGPASTQVSLEPPPREEFTISSPSASATRVSPPGSTQTRLAVVDRERPQVHVPRGQRAVHEGRHRRELHDGLGDPRPRVGEHLGPQLVQLGAGCARADHDALAARPVDRLEHQLVEPVEHLFACFRVAQPPGVDVAEHRLLAEVVADEVRQVGVDELVVGHAVADGVGEGDVAGAGRVDEAGHAEHRVGAEVHRVEELVVDAPVDHVHRLEPLGGPHHHPAPAALEVATLDELDAHRAGEQRVLEVGAVVDAGSQHDDVRVG